jgi:hypothetical protein
MVFKYKTKKTVKFEEVGDEMGGGKQMVNPSPIDENKMKVWKQRREALLKQMKNCGLDLFCFYSRDRDEIFCKVGAEPEKLMATAARMKYKLQLKPEYCSAYAEYRQDVRGRPGDGGKGHRYYSQMYERHIGPTEEGDESSIFTQRDKIFLIHHAITSKDKDCAGVAINKILHSATNPDAGWCSFLCGWCSSKSKNEFETDHLLTHYFPLHEDTKLRELTKNLRDWILMPTDHTHNVRDYFGEKVAFYYVWMSFYWKWLVIPGILGALLQVLDVAFRTPDNMTAVPFCLFLSVWSTFLPHFWRRQQAKLAIAWGTFDMVPDLEPCRPEHTGEPRINPVTAQVEPYYPWQKRMVTYMKNTVIVTMVGALLLVLIATLLWMRHNFKDDVTLPLIGGIGAWQLIMAIYVEFINYCLTVLAKCLTNRENHRTQSDHDTQLLAKVFAFKFINSYFVLYYVAFFKSNVDFFGEPLKCLRNDCFYDLQAALAIFMIVRLISQSMVQFLNPKIKAWAKNMSDRGMVSVYNFFHASSRLELADMSAAEKESKREPYDPFQDFDETLITHGYATLFSVTSPWCCCATLIWIFWLTKLDVKGLTEHTQRPLPIRVRTNEPWDTAFDIYGILAALTNMTAIVFASKEYATWTFTEKIMLFIVLIHMVLFAKLVIMSIFPAVPRSVEVLHLKQVGMVHRALENIKVEPQQDLSAFMISAGTDTHEILEQDILDDEDLDPEFKIGASFTVLRTAMKESASGPVVCLIFVAVALCMLLAVGLFIYNRVK